MESLHPQVAGFVHFCAQRRGTEWPALYDEMCRVAGQRLYQGMGYSELRNLGFSFSLNNMDKVFSIVETVTSSQSSLAHH